MSVHCEMRKLDTKLLIVFLALTSMTSYFDDMKEKLLKVPAAELNLKKFWDMTKAFEASEKAIRIISRKNDASANRASGGKSRLNGGSARTQPNRKSVKQQHTTPSPLCQKRKWRRIGKKLGNKIAVHTVLHCCPHKATVCRVTLKHATSFAKFVI